MDRDLGVLLKPKDGSTAHSDEEECGGVTPWRDRRGSSALAQICLWRDGVGGTVWPVSFASSACSGQWAQPSSSRRACWYGLVHD